jgi:hypothetical protein
MMVFGSGSASAATGTLTPGQTLAPGASITSPSGRYSLNMQTDGNLVLRTSTRVVWNAGTLTPNSHLDLAANGTLSIVNPGGTAIWTSGVTGATELAVTDGGLLELLRGSAVIWTRFATIMRMGERMVGGETLYSADGLVHLQLTTTGDLVLARASRTIWASNTAGNPGAFLILQSDGNLVLYAADGRALFNSHTWNHTGVVLSIQGDVFAAVMSGPTMLWASTDWQLLTGQTLLSGDSLYSPSRVYRLNLQIDGNLVLLKNGVPQWNAHSQGNPGDHGAMQADGNFVLYSTRGAVLFNTETWSYPRAHLELGDTGNFLIRLGGVAEWTRLNGSTAARNAATAAYNFGRSRGERVAVAVYDRKAKQTYVAGDADNYYASASVMKVFIATKLLVTGQSKSPAIAAQMWRMITLSDDNAADYLYGIVGGAGVATWAAARYHIAGIAASPNPFYWGLTRITARAMTSYYNAIYSDPTVGPWLLNAMANMHAPAADGWPQNFGIPSVTSGWRVKQGWMCCLDGVTRLNSTGFINGDRYTVAILTQGPPADYSAYGLATVTGMAARLLPHGAMPH